MLQIRSCSAQFNAYTARYEMAPPNARPAYNPHTGEYELAQAGATPKFNPHTGGFEMAGPSEKIHYHYNPFTGESGFNYCA